MTDKNKKLALLGGDPAVSTALAPYTSLGVDEEEAVIETVRSGCLSGFFGSWQKGFNGGPKVQAFESAWADYFKSRHVVSVNSNTSGLYAAMGAVGVGPGDEVIVPPTTMSATAMAPLIYGAIPVFADIDPDTFCLDMESVKDAISEKTKAIIAVNLFGQAAPLAALRALAEEKGLFLIEDNAQGPLATEEGRFCGTIGHIGIFSLNYHKHIHTGEGGMCCTDDDDLARRMRFIRNHAEAVVESAEEEDLTNMVGFNYRMTELSAAIGLVQLKAIDRHVGSRQALAEKLSAVAARLDGIAPPKVRPGCRHVYYGWVARFNTEKMGCSRRVFVSALQAEGFPCFEGYVRPLYLLPLFQKRQAIGRNGYPFSLSERAYGKGLCPDAERLYEREIFGFETCAYDVSEPEAEQLCEALQKVYGARHELAKLERQNE